LKQQSKIVVTVVVAAVVVVEYVSQNYKKIKLNLRSTLKELWEKSPG
jgi:hypothetical protein